MNPHNELTTTNKENTMQYTIGQIVNYTDERKDESPAIITWVYPDGEYSLTVFNIGNTYYTRATTKDIKPL